MLKNTQDRIALREIFINRIGAPQGQALFLLAQHVQAGCMVDLSINQQHTSNAGIAGRTSGLQLRCRLDLLQDIRRRIDQCPVPAIVTRYADGGLGARSRFEFATPNARAVPAVAVPLRETTAC